MPYVRCSHCEARRTLARKLDDYIRTPPCRSCGSKKYRVDRWRHKHERGKNAPICKDWRCCYGFIHRKGSRLCIHHPNYLENARLTWDGGRVH